MPYPSHLLLGEAVHGLPGQVDVGFDRAISTGD
jgi:hypothetical protein